MKSLIKSGLAVFVLIIINSALYAENNIAGTTAVQIDESLIRESKAAIQRGVNFLTDHQQEDGSWCGHPAITGLVCMALHNSHTTDHVEIRKTAVERGRKYILSFIQPDGSIWMAGREREYPNYTTAVSLATLAIIGNPQDEPIMRKARKYLLDSQITDKENPNLGGIGYGTSGPGQPDLSNTQWALEALYLTEYLDKEPFTENKEDSKKSDLAWKNAVQFLSRLQHVPETNDFYWVVKDKKDPNYGGFVYKTDESKASGKYEDKQTLRSYGSMTYAGLKSMIYARLKKDDPRVRAAVEWASKNYTLSENPGMGPEGHYYYLHTFAKAHAVLGEEEVVTPDGKKHLWRIDLIKELLKLQKGKGEWYNDKHGRWWESIPELVTAYALMSLEAALGPELQK